MAKRKRKVDLGKAKVEYQRLYTRLFALVMANEWYSPEAEEIRKRMDSLPGEPRDHETWGIEIGTPLYRKVIGEG